MAEHAEKMRRWLTILALALWAATAIQAAEEYSTPCPQAQISISILTQDDRSDDPANAPMVATVVSTGAMQICGAGHLASKEDKNPGGTSTAHSGINTRWSHLYIPGLEGIAERICLPDHRTTGRYIYFLRKIII